MHPRDQAKVALKDLPVLGKYHEQAAARLEDAPALVHDLLQVTNVLEDVIGDDQIEVVRRVGQRLPKGGGEVDVHPFLAGKRTPGFLEERVDVEGLGLTEVEVLLPVDDAAAGKGPEVEYGLAPKLLARNRAEVAIEQAVPTLVVIAELR